MKNVILLFLLAFSINVSAQKQTVGVFQKEANSFEGYTLIAPLHSKSTFLIDNDGRIINHWKSDYRPGAAAYLMENGDLLRAANIHISGFNGGGEGGLLERYNWDGELIWTFDCSNKNYRQHHDLEILPNGNILMMVWENRTQEELIENGRIPVENWQQGLWSEGIIELKPLDNNQAEIVWRWSVWDHLVQEHDSTKLNYGTVATTPNKMNLNYGPTHAFDWLHFNSIDYNPALDQILIGSRHLHEVWVIDHSTTTEIAATSQGGKYGKGGDILYRWGNPATYNQGIKSERQLSLQHGAEWIPAGHPYAGQIIVFNNDIKCGDGNDYSSVNIWQPPQNVDGTYQLAASGIFEPEDFTWSYGKHPKQRFFSETMSNAQPLPNGNLLICVGDRGKLMEINMNGEPIWTYLSPVCKSGIVAQGKQALKNNIFRVTKYPIDVAAFRDKDIRPKKILESYSIPKDSVSVYKYKYQGE